MPDDTPLITAYFADRHVKCPACAYDLHQNPSATCPECGITLGLRVVDAGSSVRGFRLPSAIVGWSLVISAVVQFAYWNWWGFRWPRTPSAAWQAIIETGYWGAGAILGAWLIVLSLRRSRGDGWRHFSAAYFWLCLYVTGWIGIEFAPRLFWTFFRLTGL